MLSVDIGPVPAPGGMFTGSCKWQKIIRPRRPAIELRDFYAVVESRLL